MDAAFQSRPHRSPLRPPLKWAGGKRWQLSDIRSLWTPHSGRRLVEPFCGGLSIALGLRPEKALLNDANVHLVNFYRWLKRGLAIDLPMENQEGTYYACRKRFNALILRDAATPETAALFYYLNRTCYNGLCRFSRSGAFNVPFGRYTRIHYERDFPQYQAAFRTWIFTCGDFSLVPLDRSDFVYADPPYDVPFTQYVQAGFTWDDQERTAAWLARHRGPTVLVNQATDRIISLYRAAGFTVRLQAAPRRISRTGDRNPALEVIATRNL